MGGMPMGGMPMGGMPMNMGPMAGGMPGMFLLFLKLYLEISDLTCKASVCDIPRLLSLLSDPQFPYTHAKKQNTGGPGFQNLQPHFNPAFFQQNQAAGGDWQNPHGAKRARPE